MNAGTLLLAKGGTALVGPLVVGDGQGGSQVDRVELAGDNQIANGSAVTVSSSGRLALNGFADTIGALTLSSGVAAASTGRLTVNGSLTMTGGLLSSTTGSVAGIPYVAHELENTIVGVPKRSMASSTLMRPATLIR